jgi:glutathione S-transferase
MAEVELFSAAVCPFAQRSRMLLLQKQVEFEVTEIDLNHKPANFLDISPYGKVPVLNHGPNRVWESAIVNEYLDEVYPEPPMLPVDPGQRALARIWIDFANTKFTPAFYQLLLSQEAPAQQAWREEMTRHLQFIEQEGLAQLSGQGPFWFGAHLSLVDISYYPWFERWPALEHYRGLSVPPDCPRLHRWWQAMEQQACVRATRQPGDYHIQQYVKYAQGAASGSTARDLQRYGQGPD